MTTPPLNQVTLSQLAATAVAWPAYDRSQLASGIVHRGCGAGPCPGVWLYRLATLRQGGMRALLAE